MSAPIIDGEFRYVIEVEGSGVRTFSTTNTNDFIVDRLYAIDRNYYQPQPIGVADHQFTGALLVEDVVTRVDAAFAYVKRTFMTVPSQRIESRTIAFTFPGQSRYTLNPTGGPPKATYDRYGTNKPATVFRSARVTYSYSQGQVGVNLPTQIIFQNQPVDFTGEVWTDDASSYLGATDPIVSPTTFVVSDVCRRFRGNIWERELIQVDKGT